MKKWILSPLCSAFVIPGMGQLLNQHLKKGIFMLVTVLVLMALFVVRLYQMIVPIMTSGNINLQDPMGILEKVMAKDQSVLFYLVVAFCVLWAYSIIDAFVGGMRQDKLDRVKRP
jgi:hypothetical protein